MSQSDMTQIICSIVNTQEQLARCFPLMHQLRLHLTLKEFLLQTRQQQANGYQLLQAVYGQNICGLAGFSLGQKLAWGKHLYVDDLITNENQRSMGVGGAMLKWLEQYALQHDCDQLHLDSGVQRFSAHKFYLREGFVISSHHFAKSLALAE
tara:strand:- start:91 stop:546 length:456 start_codon:yes stop_codon:yes gene_type:complete